MMHHAYYEFTVTDVNIKESKTNTNFIQYTLTTDNGERVVDNLVPTMRNAIINRNRIRFYEIPIDYRGYYTKEDLAHVIGKKARLRVKEEHYENRKFFRVEIFDEVLK